LSLLLLRYVLVMSVCVIVIAQLTPVQVLKKNQEANTSVNKLFS